MVEPARRGVTDGQRRLLFALGRARGLDRDDLRGLTPAGSISGLSTAQASELIEALSGQPGTGRPGRGTASGAQLRLIERLRNQLGFDGEDFAVWLERFGVASIDDVCDCSLARKIIGALARMQRFRCDPRVELSKR